jgi:hypothetical protein
MARRTGRITRTQARDAYCRLVAKIRHRPDSITGTRHEMDAIIAATRALGVPIIDAMLAAEPHKSGEYKVN